MALDANLDEYEALEKEVFAYYEWAYGERLPKKQVTNTLVPLLYKLINKQISDVNEYPSQYFDCKKYRLFCFLIEKKLKFRLNKSESQNVKRINQYLKGE